MTTHATKGNPSEPLTWEKLVAMRDSIPKPVYTFRIPKLDQDLDIRDYELREVEGMYLLRRKEAIFDPSNLDTGFFPLHPAHFILLEGATPELARELLAMFPELIPRAAALSTVKEQAG